MTIYKTIYSTWPGLNDCWCFLLMIWPMLNGLMVLWAELMAGLIFLSLMMAEWLLNGELHVFYNLLLLMMWSNFLYHLSWSGLDYFILVHCFGQVATRWKQKTAKTDNKNSVEISLGHWVDSRGNLEFETFQPSRSAALRAFVIDCGWVVQEFCVHFSKRMRLESWCKTQEIIAIGKCRILPESSSPGFGPVFQDVLPFYVFWRVQARK
jgi:hypothetical protein